MKMPKNLNSFTAIWAIHKQLKENGIKILLEVNDTSKTNIDKMKGAIHTKELLLLYE